MVIKKSLKSILKKIPISFTSNQRYDAQTKRIMQIVLEQNSTFVDVGSHKGEVLSKALKIAPEGRHYAFEPIPHIHKELDSKYGQYCEIKNIGISNHFGESVFNHVTSNPAYSGIKQREYPKEENIEEIKIQVDTLDNQLFYQERVDLIKIDVIFYFISKIVSIISTIWMYPVLLISLPRQLTNFRRCHHRHTRMILHTT